MARFQIGLPVSGDMVILQSRVETYEDNTYPKYRHRLGPYSETQPNTYLALLLYERHQEMLVPVTKCHCKKIESVPVPLSFHACEK